VILFINELGQVVHHFSNLEETFNREISMSDNEKGVYWIEIRDAEQTVIRKFVKQ
jgi:hypothetical protein